MYCPACGTKIPPDGASCPQCGTQVTGIQLGQPTAQPKKRRRPLVIVGIVALVMLCLCLAMFGALAPNSNQGTVSAPKTEETDPQLSKSASAETKAVPERASSTQEPSERFDLNNWSVLDSDPARHKGAAVEIVGRVFVEPERQDDSIGLQMWADPRNSEWNTLVIYRDPSIAVKNGDYVQVIGKVRGAFKGENAFGGKIIAPLIDAETVTVVDALAAAPLARRTVNVNESQEQHNLQLTVEKVEFAEDETRLFLKVVNGSNNKASFYSFNAKAVQGTSQFDVKYSSDYPKVQSELLPGIESAGVVIFPELQPDQPTKFYLEARTGDYSLDFEPYVFEIQP